MAYLQGAELLVLGSEILRSINVWGLWDWGLGWLVACTAWNNSTSEKPAPQNPRGLLGTCKTQRTQRNRGPGRVRKSKVLAADTASVISWGWVIIISFAIFPLWVSLIAGKKWSDLIEPGRFFEPRFFGVLEISSFKGSRIESGGYYNWLFWEGKKFQNVEVVEFFFDDQNFWKSWCISNSNILI